MHDATDDQATARCRRQSVFAALALGVAAAVLFGLAVPLPVLLSLALGIAVAAIAWWGAVTFFCGAPHDATQADPAMPAQARLAEPQPQASEPPESPEPVRPADPLPVTRTDPPQVRVRSRKMPPLDPASEGPADGLDAAVARSRTATPVKTSGPERLGAPRGGRADDLTLIRGIGPKLAALLNDAGIWHFDQIAAWKARDIAEIDARIGRFRGRITRDAWVRQARALVDTGNVPTDAPRRARR